MKIEILTFDDWEALYVDGKLKDQGHSLRVDSVLSALGFNVEKRYVNNYQVDDLNHFGNSCPDSLEELKTHYKL
jgi:hypothetical protein